MGWNGRNDWDGVFNLKQNDMRRSRNRVATWLILLLFLFLGGKSAWAGPVEWNVSTEAGDDGTIRLLFTARIDTPWHIYDVGPYDDMGPNATTVVFEPNESVTLVGGIEQLSKPVRFYDSLFMMEIGYFEQTARLAQTIRVPAGVKTELKARVEWMACNDENCLPPDEQDFTIPLQGPEDAGHSEGSSSIVSSEEGAASGQLSGVNEQEVDSKGNAPRNMDADSIEYRPLPDTSVRESVSAADPTEMIAAGENSGDKSLWGLIVEAILWGFAALLTPCVFPMVPMTVSFFLKQNESRFKARVKAGIYGLSIVALYTVPIAIIILITRWVGGGAVTADIFNWLATHWLPNVLFFLVFIVFAISFFGAFEITLPSRLVNRSDRQSDRGGVVGIFFMALTLVLVSFSCTGPIVGAVLIQSTAGAVWTPVLTMLAFSVAFALPFTLLALFPSMLDRLPRSGGWLNSVKVVLGFVELALALKFLSVADQTYHWGILDREVYLAFWIVIFTLLGFYLLGKLRFPHDTEVKHIGVTRLLLAIVTFSFVVYMLPGMWGAPLRGLSGYLPPLETQDFRPAETGNTTESVARFDTGFPKEVKHGDLLKLPHGLQGFFDLDEALDYARKVKKPLFVDYTGHGCVNCREMEARVWSDPQVLDLLRNDFVIVALYSDDKKQLPESEWITTEHGRVLKGMGKINAYRVHKQFGINAQPYYMILGTNGGQLVPGRGYDLDVARFISFLQEGLRAYRGTEQ